MCNLVKILILRLDETRRDETRRDENGGDGTGLDGIELDWIGLDFLRLHIIFYNRYWKKRRCMTSQENGLQGGYHKKNEKNILESRACILFIVAFNI